MTNPTTRMRRAHLILLDATTTLALIEPALRAIDTALAGWPTSTPGANPDTPAPPTTGEHDTATQTERAALQPDPARTALTELDKALIHAETANRRLATLITRWATPALDGSTIAERLAAIDARIWCTNCSRHNHRNTRAPNSGDLCEFCKVFRRDWAQLPNKDILDLRSTKGRLYESDIRRILARARDERKNKPKGAA